MAIDDPKKLLAMYQRVTNLEDTPLLPLDDKDIETQAHTYESMEEIEICDFEGGPPITTKDEYLTDAHRVFWVPHDQIDEKVEQPLLEKSYKGKPLDFVHFLKPDEVAKRAGVGVNPVSDEVIQRIQANMYDFRFERPDKDAKVHYKLCRSENKEADGGYRLWAYGKNLFLDNSCPSNASAIFKPVLNLPENVRTYDGRVKLIQATDLKQPEYCYSGNELSTVLFITQDLDRVETVKKNLSASKFFDEATKKAIVTAMDSALKPVNENRTRMENADKRGEESVSAANRNIWIIGGLSLVGMLLGPVIAVKTSEWINRVDPNDFVTDETVAAAQPDYTRVIRVPEVEEILMKIEAALNKDRPHIIVEGGTGCGKDAVVNLAAHLFVTGKFDLRESSIKGRHVSKTDTTDIEAAGAQYVGLGAKVIRTMFKVLRKLGGLGIIQEFQNLVDAGKAGDAKKGTAHKILTALEKKRPNFGTVATTSDFAYIKKQVKDMERRFVVIHHGDYCFESLLTILNEVSPQILKNGSSTTTVDNGLYEAIIYFAKFRDASPNAQTIDMLEELATQARLRERKGMGANHISLADLIAVAKSDAATNGMNVSEDTLYKSLEFFKENPDLTREEARRASQLIELDQDPALTFADEGTVERAMRSGIEQKKLAARSARQKSSQINPPSGDSAPAPAAGTSSAAGSAVEDLIAIKGEWEAEIGRAIGDDAIRWMAQYFDPTDPHIEDGMRGVFLEVDAELKKMGYPEGEIRQVDISSYVIDQIKKAERTAKPAVSEAEPKDTATSSKPKGRGKPPPPPSSEPPAAAGGSDPAAPAKKTRGRTSAASKKPGGGGEQANRISIEEKGILEKATGPLMIGSMGVSTVLEHFGWITPEQQKGIDIGMAGGMIAAHLPFLAELPLLSAPAAAGHELVQKGLEMAGVGRKTLASKLSGLAGAMGAMEATAYAVGRGAGATGMNALAAGHTMLQNAVIKELPARIGELKNAAPAIAASATAAITSGITALQTAAASAATTISASAAATAGVTLAAGLAVGAGIHFSGAGKYLGLDWLGEKTGDGAFALKEKFFGDGDSEPRIAIAERNRNAKKVKV